MDGRNPTRNENPTLRATLQSGPSHRRSVHAWIDCVRVRQRPAAGEDGRTAGRTNTKSSVLPSVHPPSLNNERNVRTYVCRVRPSDGTGRSVSGLARWVRRSFDRQELIRSFVHYRRRSIPPSGDRPITYARICRCVVYFCRSIDGSIDLCTTDGRPDRATARRGYMYVTNPRAALSAAGTTERTNERTIGPTDRYRTDRTDRSRKL